MRIAVRVLIGFLGRALMALMGTIARANGANVLMYHNNIQRTGWNRNETSLTPANVTPSTFGLMGSVPVDGRVDAQPLVVAGLMVGGNKHTVVYVATENNRSTRLMAHRGISW
jgi:hypothetical protein